MSGIIVVGVDDSATARRAAESARQLARALGSPLHIVTAFDSDRAEVYGSGSDRRVVTSADDAEQVARQVAADLDAGELQVSHFAVRGTPASALIRHAETYAAHTIVVGNRRMKGLGRVLGSVANSVAHGAACDVYIVNTDTEPDL